MAMHNPKGRANYEPNSWGQGPRENPQRGYRHYEEALEGRKTRERGELFADHYSQARQFLMSQTPPERTHIKNAFVFELSKCLTPAIRSRVVAHLRNVDEDLAKAVAAGLRLEALPDAAPPARKPITGLPPSDKLSILKNGPASFAGRKIGVVVTDGTDAGLLKALLDAAKAEGANVELVAPEVGGVKTTDGKLVPAGQKIVGAPSVLYDAVVLLPSADGAKLLTGEATARDFVADAYAHAKFIGYGPDSEPLLAKGGITPADKDDGIIPLATAADLKAFIQSCRGLRFWERESKTHAV